jgi:hypothetical protein
VVPKLAFVTAACVAIAVVIVSSITLSHLIVSIPSILSFQARQSSSFNQSAGSRSRSTEISQHTLRARRRSRLEPTQLYVNIAPQEKQR